MLGCVSWLPVVLSYLIHCHSYVSGSQVHLTEGEPGSEFVSTTPPWNQPLGEDATGHHIFNSFASLLQMAPNSKYTRGHSIVRATIPPGTLLYHGRPNATLPQRPDWIAFDPEFSFIYTGAEDGTLFTYMSTRELNVVYFDGASANKMDGVADTQDILFRGETREPNLADDPMRIHEGCTWGKRFGVDGFVRMEFDLWVIKSFKPDVLTFDRPLLSELMYCNFSEGLKLVSALNSLFPSPPGNESDPPTPKGWKGSQFLRRLIPEVWHVGTWHNFPGEGRVRPDLSTFTTFFDPSLTSLIPERRGKTRAEYSLRNISSEDILRTRDEFVHALERPRSEWSGVNWLSLAQVITDRFSDRLPFLRYLLHNTTAYSNASLHAAEVRKYVGISLISYMSRVGIENRDAWLEDIAHGCASFFTSALPRETMTRQELVLLGSVEEVLHEICRVYTTIWGEAFDVEEQPTVVSAKKLAAWTQEIDRLIDWLDWPIWIACHPACALNEFCYLSQHWFYALRPPVGADMNEPYCVDIHTSEIIQIRPLPEE